MELIEIDEVRSLGGTSEHLAGASVEVPAAGTRRDEWWISISGWVVGWREPVTSIEVVQQDIRVASAPVEIVREDVAHAHPGLPGAQRAGFSVRIGGVWLPESFVLRLEAGFANGHRVPFALVRGRRAGLPAAPAGDATIEPVSVTALPRSGATLVMQMLAAHPEVVVAGAHPYSARPAAYWTHMVRVLSAPADWRHSTHPDTFDADSGWVGSHPLNGPPLTDDPELAAWFGREYVAELSAFATRSASELYARVGSSQGLRAPRFYAEKREPGATARLGSTLHPGGREILVVRDFRDMACSMLAFAQKTGTGDARDDEEFVLSLVPSLTRLVAYAHERGDAALTVRYEDLVAQPAQTFERIVDHLGLKCEPRRRRAIAAEATAQGSHVAAHRTSPDASSSVGRHMQDMDPAVLAAAEESFGPALDAFGYARTTSVVMV
ncbi:MAG TPA: sulfotransferase [Conexibacter sp.]|jgi:hypothetical protein|nr:sulfotransferase [Conexibacter sp.]